MPNLIKTLQKVNSFARLKEGWRFGEGMPITPDFLESAKLLLKEGARNNISRFNAFPAPDGSLMVSFYIEDYTMDLHLEADGSITYSKYSKELRDEEIDYKEDISFDSAIRKIWNFSKEIDILESSTLEIGTAKETALKASRLYLRLKQGRIDKEYQYTKLDVQLTTADAISTTSQNTTKRLRENLLFFGYYPQNTQAEVA